MATHLFMIRSGIPSGGQDGTFTRHQHYTAPFPDTATFLQVRDSALANNADFAIVVGTIGCAYSYGYEHEWRVDRLFLFFKQPYDLGINGITIASAYIRFDTEQIFKDDGNYDVVIQKANSTDIHHQPPVAEDYNKENIEAAIGGTKNTSEMVSGDWVNIYLNATGISWIGLEPNSILKVVLRSSQEIAGTAPVVTYEGWSRLDLMTVSTGNYTIPAPRPYLYIAIDVHLPEVTTLPATNIALPNATLNGEITDKGHWIGSYGFQTKRGLTGTITTTTVGTDTDQTITTFSYNKTGLSVITTNYVRAWCTNEAGTGYGEWIAILPTSVTTQAATQIAYHCAIGNGTITSGTNATERGFETKVYVDYFGVGADLTWGMMGFNDEGEIVYHDFGQRTGYLVKRDMEEGDFEAGVFEDVLGHHGLVYDIWGTPDYMFNDMLEKCTSYTYRAYAIIDDEPYYGEWVAFSTLCENAPPTDDISEGDPTVPIIPIEPEPEYPPFEYEYPPEIPYPPWDWDLPPWDYPDYPPMSFVGDFYYHKPYTKKDLDELRAKCIIYNKNSVEFALVLRHNMNVLREFFNIMTDYLDKDEFNDFTDIIPPQRLKELYLDPLEVNDFKDMINGFIRNTVDNNIAVNRNFSLIQEGLADPQANNEEGYFTDIYSAMKTVTEDNPDVDTLKRVVDNLNQETALNFNTIMHNLEILRARLL